MMPSIVTSRKYFNLLPSEEYILIIIIIIIIVIIIIIIIVIIIIIIIIIMTYSFRHIRDNESIKIE